MPLSFIGRPTRIV